MTVDDVVTRMPYARFLGIAAEVEDGRLITRITFRPNLVGNARLPAIHGGVVGAFLEMAATLELLHETDGERIPKPINFSINYLRSAGPRHCAAQATVVKLGKRVAHVRAAGWQEDSNRPFAEGYGNFLF